MLESHHTTSSIEPVETARLNSSATAAYMLKPGHAHAAIRIKHAGLPAAPPLPASTVVPHRPLPPPFTSSLLFSDSHHNSYLLNLPG
jgi:hypothetical protein